MVYLDYSATTPVSDEVLASFIKASKYIGNPNSVHKLGLESKHLIDASSKQIADILNIKPNEIIYTSGATEANNMAIKGIEIYRRGNHIITTDLEHSSIYGPLEYLEKKGYKVDIVPLKDGIVDINALKGMIKDDTILVSIGCVNSETGIRQPIEEIGKLLKEYSKVIFHSDVTQAIGKIKIDLINVDLASFSAHKFFGIKGIGCLIKKDNIKLEPLIAGGKSTTIYRSGTPPTALIVSMAKALRLAYQSIDDDIKHVSNLNNRLKNGLKDICINSNDKSIAHILNISVINVKPETMLHALEEDDIYISTQSACSTKDVSRAVLAITGSKEKASSSLRISISKRTTLEEIDKFIASFKNKYERMIK